MDPDLYYGHFWDLIFLATFCAVLVTPVGTKNCPYYGGFKRFVKRGSTVLVIPSRKSLITNPR